MKTGNTKTSIWLCMAALFSLATAWGEGLATTEDQAVPSDFRVLDLSKVPILHGRDGKMRAVLESIVDTEYCGEALAEGVTHVAALCGMAPVKGIGFVKLDEKDWPVVLTEMANEEFERLLQEGKLHSIMDVKRLRNMIGLLGTARCDAAPILAFFRKMAERATPKWQTVLFMSISCAWIDLTIEKDGAEKSLELGRILESSCGTDSMITGIFLEQLGWCDAFGRCKTQEDLAALSRFVMEVAEKCQNEGRASSIDSIAAGEAYFHPAEDDTASFTIGKPKMGVPGWKGSIQRKRLAERFKDEPAKPSTYRIDANTGERIYPAPTQRDIDRMIWSRAASELATEDSELTDLREVYGDWTKEKTEE
jgi:hypothetical protein